MARWLDLSSRGLGKISGPLVTQLVAFVHAKAAFARRARAYFELTLSGCAKRTTPSR